MRRGETDAPPELLWLEVIHAIRDRSLTCEFYTGYHMVGAHIQFNGNINPVWDYLQSIGYDSHKTSHDSFYDLYLHKCTIDPCGGMDLIRGEIWLWADMAGDDNIKALMAMKGDDKQTTEFRAPRGA